MNERTLRVVIVGSLLVLGCGGGGGGSSEEDVPLFGFYLNSSSVEVAQGSSVKLVATGLYSGHVSKRDLTAVASWTSDDPQIAAVHTGVVTGLSEGTTIIRASMGKWKAEASVTVGHNLKAFLTPMSSTANLSTWPGAGGKTGLAAADAICQASAEAAGLPRTFRAWLADSRDDAWCRVAGYSGKTYPDRCGQAALPRAGPWVRIDGFPFTQSPDDLGQYEVYVPIRFDAYGEEVDDIAWSYPYGSGSPCQDWTSSASDPDFGLQPSYQWSLSTRKDLHRLNCNQTARLLCLEVGVGAPAPIPPSSARVAFITSVSGSGKLSTWADSRGRDGVAGADAVCQARAAAASLANPTRFKAWLTDGTVGPLDRLTSDGPWARVDGVPLASNKAELRTLPLFTTLDLTELGARAEPTNPWTGTDTDPNVSGDTCSGWSSDGPSLFGNAGYSTNVRAWWGCRIEWGNRLRVFCSVPKPLYCFED